MPKISTALLRNAAIKLIHILARAGAAEKSALIMFALCVGAFYAFGSLADEVIEGDTRTFDEFILLALRDSADPADPIGPPWFEEVMRDFTALGGIAVLTALTLTVVGFLALTRKRHAATLVAGAVTGGVILSSLLKWGFDRPRPDLVTHLSLVHTQSFPSGHAMLSAVVYLTLGVLLARTLAEPRVKIYLLSVAALATILVGISRVYLGVHWPTDVLAGWAIGAAWAMACWFVMLWLQGRGTVEEEAPGEHVDAPPSRTS